MLWRFCWLIFLFASEYVSSQNLPGIVWDTCWGHPQVFDFTNDAALTSDKGWILVGTAEDAFSIKQDFIARFDSTGHNTFNSSQFYDVTGLKSIQKTDDGGFILSGINNQEGLWIGKTDSSLSLEWEEQALANPYDFKSVATQAKDGGYFLAGNNGYDLLIAKLNNSGDFLWQKTIGGSGLETIVDAVSLNNGDVLILANTGSNDGDVIGNHGINDYWLVLMNSVGDIVWQKCFGGSDGDYANNLAEVNDNLFLLSGSSRSSDGDVTQNYDEMDYWVIAVDSNSNLLWQKNYGGSKYDFATGLALLQNHHILVSGTSYSHDHDVTYNQGYSDEWFIEIDSTGNLLWSKTFGASSYDEEPIVLPINDSLFLSIGRSFSVREKDLSVDCSDSATNALGYPDSFGSIWFSKIANYPAACHPNAEFTAQHHCEDFTFTNFSCNAQAVLWSFGDGSTSTDFNPTHSYNDTSSYTVTLVASDSCSSDTTYQLVTAYVAMNPGFQYSNSGLTVIFTGWAAASTSSWLWDFGDGATDTIQNPVHTYAATGVYNVTLSVMDSCGINYASITYVVSTCGPLAFQFFPEQLTCLDYAFTPYDTTGNPYLWYWDFGDGTSAYGFSTTHHFESSGNQYVCVYATDSCETVSSCQTVYVPNPSVPNFGYTSDVNDSLTIHFSDSSQNAISRIWDFGDGATSNLLNPDHTYSQQGTYTVCLTANAEYCFDSICKTIEAGITGINSIDASMAVSIFPNPAHDLTFISIQTNRTSEIKIELTSVIGQVILDDKTNNLKAGIHRLPLDLSSIATGVYLIRISIGPKVFYQKLAKN